MKKLSDLIAKRLNQHKLGESSASSHVLSRANEYLAKWLKSMPEEVRAITLKNGILIVGVIQPVWGQEVWGIKRRLLATLQDEFGIKILQKIVTKSLTST